MRASLGASVPCALPVLKPPPGASFGEPDPSQHAEGRWALSGRLQSRERLILPEGGLR